MSRSPKLTRRTAMGAMGAMSAFAALGLGRPAFAQAKTTLKLGHLANEENVWHKASLKFAEEVAKRLSSGMGSTSAPSGSIPPESQAASTNSGHGPELQDRGLFHASDAMRGMYEMGDAPSCSTCGAIMVRNGSCYRCMSCGSTSGCS